MHAVKADRLDMAAGEGRRLEHGAGFFFDHQQTDAAMLVGVAGAHIGEDQIGAVGECRELLGAVDDIAIPLPLGRRLDIGGIRSGLGLGSRSAGL